MYNNGQCPCLVSRSANNHRFARWLLVVSTWASVTLLGCGPHTETYSPNQPTDYNVILVTLDGVRWQELFLGSDPLLGSNREPLFGEFWASVAPRGEVYGDPREGSEMLVSTAANASLPGYMSIFAEQQQGCVTNHCGRIEVSTFVDRIHDELSVDQKKSAVFASWSKLSLAVSSRDDVATVRAGDFGEVVEEAHPEKPLLDASMDFDRGTVLEGLAYLQREKPRFFYLSLLDSDRFAHQGRYDMVETILRAYDRLLVDLVRRIDQSGEYGRKTALIITTDHGRGLHDQWSDHGPQTPSSANVWAFVMLPKAAKELMLVPPRSRSFNHHDVRFTIERLFGLGTTSSSGFSSGFVDDKPRGAAR